MFEDYLDWLMDNMEDLLEEYTRSIVNFDEIKDNFPSFFYLVLLKENKDKLGWVLSSPTLFKEDEECNSLYLDKICNDIDAIGYLVVVDSTVSTMLNASDDVKERVESGEDPEDIEGFETHPELSVFYKGSGGSFIAHKIFRNGEFEEIEWTNLAEYQEPSDTITIN